MDKGTGSGTHPAIVAAMICAVATILAGLLPRMWDRYVPARSESEPAPAASPAPATFETTPVTTTLPVTPVIAAGATSDDIRNAWGQAIAGMNHSNLGTLTNQYVERFDTHGDGYPELQREDRDADGFFELYRVDVDADNSTDYWFAVDPSTGQVYVVGPR